MLTIGNVVFDGSP